ncbi:MAG TPA: type I phosphomannose isomerase catalytic subunit, partial [Terriglobia bacterium]|nr:type I phosphomannose isomerase catalytic subunit [Terriglobia bacterium]
MPKLDSPLQLSPVFKPKVWGRRDLAPLYPDHWTTHRGKTVGIHYPQRKGEDLIGEVWLTDDAAVFTNGPVAGSTLAKACKRYGAELCGDNAQDRRFPVLAKFLFTNDWLSVQVHPDDDYASRHERGSRGKCEMWYMIRAEARAEFMLGLKPAVNLEQLGARSKEGGCQHLLQRFRAEAAEAVFV